MNFLIGNYQDMHTTLEVSVLSNAMKSSTSDIFLWYHVKTYLLCMRERFSSNYNLKQHMNSHSKERHSKCDIFSRAFRRSYNLKSLIRSLIILQLELYMKAFNTTLHYMIFLIIRWIILFTVKIRRVLKSSKMT